MTEAVGQKLNGAEEQPKRKVERKNTFNKRIQMKTDVKRVFGYKKSVEFFEFIYDLKKTSIMTTFTRKREGMD